MVIPKPMIEKIALPRNLYRAGNEFLPIANDRLDSWFSGKGNDSMQMIGH